MRGKARNAWLAMLVGVLVAVTLSAARTGSTAGSAQSRWVLTDLGKDCLATAINEQGEIVGGCFKSGIWHGILWRNGKLTDLGRVGSDLATEPLAINAVGQIIGRAVRYGPVGNTDGPVKSSAFLWRRGQLIKLANLGLRMTRAVAINSLGQIVGYGVTKER